MLSSFSACAVVGPIATVVVFSVIIFCICCIGVFSVSILKMFFALSPLPKRIAFICPFIRSLWNLFFSSSFIGMFDSYTCISCTFAPMLASWLFNVGVALVVLGILIFLPFMSLSFRASRSPSELYFSGIRSTCMLYVSSSCAVRGPTPITNVFANPVRSVSVWFMFWAAS